MCFNWNDISSLKCALIGMTNCNNIIVTNNTYQRLKSHQVESLYLLHHQFIYIRKPYSRQCYPGCVFVESHLSLEGSKNPTKKSGRMSNHSLLRCTICNTLWNRDVLVLYVYIIINHRYLSWIISLSWLTYFIAETVTP